MVETAGTKLRRARTQRHLSLADAARATKIRAIQLADLESDDYSNFANLAYARGFLVSYGKYLHLDVEPYLDAFADASTFGLDDYQYLNETPLGEYRAPARPWRKRKQGSVKQVLAVAAAFVVLAVTVFGGYVYVSYRRLGNLDRLVERQNGPVSVAPAVVGEGTARPGMVPVSSAPVPSVSSAPDAKPSGPEIVPTDDGNRSAAAALAMSARSNSPAALLTQLTMPAVKSLGNPGTPLASPAPGGEASLLVHAPDKNAAAYLSAAPKPQKVSNNTLE